METDQKRFIRKTFNDEFMKFVNEVHTIFPEDRDIRKARDGLELLKKANPKVVIRYIENAKGIRYLYASADIHPDIHIFL